jgi:topoisomerase-4 subunit A
MKQTPLSGMFRDWYIEYASYVILERAVPHIEDGLKPVQRRILHTMKTLDDGRFNKVANIVGSTMSYHPHGDASIGDALVTLGQKQLLVDTQGNWGNILTGDGAAAPRYIEARLSEFAIETVFSPKITQWTKSYDGRKDEPVTLPVKFPLLLVQGVEGIAVALSSRILPHNFNEVLDAAVECLHGRPFRLLPDFPTGGLMDASRYNDGARGGSVRIRAKIEKLDAKTLVITELPYGKTTETLIASIIAAMEKGKIKISKIDDNTASEARIVIHLPSQSSSDKTIDALYAFTDCEVSISSNCCVIRDKRPEFLSVTELLQDSVNRTVDILRRELEIKLAEAQESRLFASLEKIFIEERIYKDQQIEKAPDMETAIRRVDVLLEPFKDSFYRQINDEDLIRLWEIKMGRILKFNSEKADEKIARLSEEIEKITFDIDHIIETTERWYIHLKEKYGEHFPRLTTLRSFDSIEATKVAEANRRLYWDRDGGFIGTALKDNEFLFPCSDLDDILVIYRDGKYKIVRVADKLFIDKKVIYIGLYKKRDERTVYNVIYRNGKGGNYYMKRCFITGLTREKEYDLTKGMQGSRIEWLTSNPNGEAETVRVSLADEINVSGRRPRNTELSIDFAKQAIKGKESLGNLVTKYKIKSVSLEKRGSSTLGGREVWFDADVLRLNYDGRGVSLGVFQGDDKVLVICKDGTYFTSTYAESNHYEDNILKIEKFDPDKVWTLVLFDKALGYPYLKRFPFETSPKPQRFVGGDEGGDILLLTDQRRPFITLEFEEDDRPPLNVDAEEFISVKSFKAKGKRLTLNEIASVSSEDLNPPTDDEPEEMVEAGEPEAEVTEATETAEPAESSEGGSTMSSSLFDFDD